MKSYVIQIIFSLLPDTRFFPFKAFLLRLRGFQIGKDVRVVSSAKFKLRYLSIGDNTFISHDTMIEGGDVPVVIGNNVDIGPRCIIAFGTHEIGDSTHRAGKSKSEPIDIGDGTWIGASVTILGGVQIGKGCIVAAGSIVRKDIEENCMVAGVPAKFIKKLT